MLIAYFHMWHDGNDWAGQCASVQCRTDGATSGPTRAAGMAVPRCREDDPGMQVEILGTKGPVLAGVTVGIQRRAEVVEEQPADGGHPRWTFEVEIRQGDFRAPYVHGRPGARFLYLSWHSPASGRFRRAKLMLDAVPRDVIEAAQETTLRAEVILTMSDGGPLCAAVRPPAVAWSAA